METKKIEFKVSDIISNMESRAIDYRESDEIKNITDIEEKHYKDLMNKAFIKICQLWNKDIKSRNFIKHLILNFIPVNEWNKILNFPEKDLKENKNHCCILNIKLIGIRKLSEELAIFKMKQLRITAEFDDVKKQKLIDEYNSEIKKLPVEIKFKYYAYSGNKSDKYLSKYAITALNNFVNDCIICGEKEIHFLVNKMRFKQAQERFPKNKQLNNSELNKVIKSSTFGLRNIVDNKTLEKLKVLKDGIGMK